MANRAATTQWVNGDQVAAVTKTNDAFVTLDETSRIAIRGALQTGETVNVMTDEQMQIINALSVKDGSILNIDGLVVIVSFPPGGYPVTHVLDAQNNAVKFSGQVQGNGVPFAWARYPYQMPADADVNPLPTAAVQVRRLVVTSAVALTANRNLVVPTVVGEWYVTNSTTGGQTITIKTAAGTGIAIANGKTALVECDGVNVLRLTADV